jgi:large subunit ribosomal protein L3
METAMAEAAEKENLNTGADEALKLQGLFTFKVGMSTVYDDKGDAVPVTILRFDPWIVSQVKTKDKDGYAAVQLSSGPRRAGRTSKAQKAHLKSSKFFENGALFTREIRQDELPDGVAVGQKVSIESFAKGDIVKVTAKSRGRGFQGSVKRYGFAGGPAAHGSHFHRQPGSSGNRTWPGRIMPGKKFPGHMGDKQFTVRKVTVVDVIPEDNVILVKGQVPGAANGLVRIMKES